MSQYDSIVIGAGHNGLVCATLLARIGQRVLVLEANEQPGGLAADREFHPGFHAPVASTLYALPDEVISDLRLADYGFKLPASTLDLVALSASEDPITIGAETLTGAGEADSEAYPAYLEQLQTFQAALAPFWSKTMPRIGDTDKQALMTFAHMGMKLRLMGKTDMLEFFRVATLPMRDLVDEHFESEALKAALCWDGMVGTKIAPRSPNQAVLTLLNRMAGAQGGQHAVPTGGMGGFIAALTSAAEAAGVEMRLATAVERVVIEGSESGQSCTGVELADGEILRADRVISSADPKTTFLRLVGAANLEIEFTNRIRRLRSDGYVARLNLALGDEPQFSGMARADGRMILAESMDSIEFAWDDAKYGNCPESPVMEVVLPSMHESGLAPTGQHVLCANVMYVPAQLEGGWDDAKRDALTNKLIGEIARYAPGIDDMVLHAELLTPADLQQQYHVSGGHWHHAEPAIDQLLMMRPTYEAAQYRTPIDGLFLCGAGSHPGGDVTGNPGRNAAREILA
ncbi:MAG: NAD(P)/FAD-dependent oxidoreductase [Pseudomonadota bacterium]